MSAIPADYLPPRALGPERVYTLPEHARYPERLNSTEELIDRQVEGGHGDRIAILYEDQRITYRQLEGSVNRLGWALRAPRAPGPAGAGTGKLLRRILREQGARA